MSTAAPQEFNTALKDLLADPNTIYILLMLGFYGIFFELAHPGFAIPGIIGVAMLSVAFYGLQALPISYAGLSLLVIGMLLMLTEVFIPTFGGLGVVGIICFVIGSLFLFDSKDGSLYVAWPVIAGTTIANASFIAFIIGMAVQARRKKVVTGLEGLVGKTGVAMEDFTEKGLVQVQGEIWTAESTTPILKGEKITVVSVEGLTLKIRSE